MAYSSSSYFKSLFGFGKHHREETHGQHDDWHDRGDDCRDDDPKDDHSGLDGTVEGTSGSDHIDYAYTGDPEGDMVDAKDALDPARGDEDLIYGYGGDDTIEAGDADDTVYAGAGNDTVYGGNGDDTIEGGEGEDVLHGDGGSGDGTTTRESFEWDKAPDPNGGVSIDDGDSLRNGFSQDTGSVTVDFCVVSQSVGMTTGFSVDEQNTDGVEGDGGEVDANSSLDSETHGKDHQAEYSFDFSDPVQDISFNVNDIDGDGVVRIEAYGPDGKPVEVHLEGGSKLTLLDTDGVAGADTADSQEGYLPDTSDEYSLTVSIDGPVSSFKVIHRQDGYDNSGVNITDIYYDVCGPDTGEAGDDSIDGGLGDDVIYGEEGDDTLDGGVDDDTLNGGAGDDTAYGGQGDDVITGGDGKDDLFGNADRDTFYGGNAGDYVDGGGTGEDYDTLDLTGVDFDQIVYTSDDRENGYVTFGDTTDPEDPDQVLNFREIENVVPCFTPGTLIATPRGEIAVEALREGDRVITRDNGIQEIRWVGHKTIGAAELRRSPYMKPVLIRAGALGKGLPERDMLVSPNHRMLISNDKTQLYFEEHEVLAAAKHLTGTPGIQCVDTLSTTYIHFMFDHHEVVLSDGAWTESFQPGDYTLKGIGDEQRKEIFELFPELASRAGIEGYQAARKSLKKHEARLLVS